ncbi:MAG: hypothetical protein R3266_03110, partial [Gemmatimonadota bacterium]|nr:hypothetical protein [Gemmatimonadota bacterium]
FNLLAAGHLFLGGTFAFLLCRRLGLGSPAAYVGAVTWMLGGYFASLLNLLNALQGAAWAPGLAWAALRAAERSTPGAWAGLVVVGCLAVLAGEPQSMLLAGLVTLVILALWLARRRPPRARFAALAGRFALAGAFVIGLVMIQLLPTLELLGESGRGRGLTYGEAAAFDLDPVRLIHLVVPPDYRDPEYAFGVRSIIGRGDPWLFSIYLGAAFPLLLRFAWGDPTRRREALAWTTLALGGLVVALGDSTPVFGWLFAYLPGFGSFRFPEKYVFLTAFAAMVLAARGADRLFSGARHRGDAFLAGLYVAVPVAGLALFRASREAVRSWALRFGNDRTFEDFDYAFGVWSQNLGKLALLCALFVALIWLKRRGSLSRPVFVVLLCALVTADLAIGHRDLNPAVDRSFYEDEPLVLRHVPLEEIRTRYRYRSSRFDSLAGTVPVIRGVPLEAQKWVWQQTMGPNVGQSWRVLQQDAWDAIKLRRWVDERDLHRAIPDAGRRWKLLRLHSVRWVHSLIDIPVEGHATEIPLDTLPGRLFEIVDPLPRAYVVPAAKVVATATEAINEVLGPAFDPATAVVLIDSAATRDAPSGPTAPAEPTESAEAGEAPGPPAARSARIVSDRGSRVRVAIDPGSPGFLVLTDSYYPGWRAFVDGEERPIELANFFFRGVRVGPGDREVVFAYRSRAFETGRLVSLVTLAIGLILFTALRRRAVARPMREA